MCILAAVLSCMLLVVSASPLSDYGSSNSSSSSSSSGDMEGESGALDNTTTATAPAVEEEEEEEEGMEGEMEEGSGGGVEERDSCPNCCKKPSDMSSCLKGSRLGRIDHTTAFGFPSNNADSWSNCALPRFPQAK